MSGQRQTLSTILGSEYVMVLFSGTLQERAELSIIWDIDDPRSIFSLGYYGETSWDLRNPKSGINSHLKRLSFSIEWKDAILVELKITVPFKKMSLEQW